MAHDAAGPACGHVHRIHPPRVKPATKQVTQSIAIVPIIIYLASQEKKSTLVTKAPEKATTRITRSLM